ncbi:MAG: glycoside hydrolase family protein [Verrucomicrobiota bacterium]
MNKSIDPKNPVVPFAERLQPAIRGGGFIMNDYWVWCGSVVHGEDGRYHMFAARWPKEYPFFKGYQTASEIVRASADKPEGPYNFEEIVLPERGSEFWDGRMTHNPFIIKYGDEYLLFYIGATYEGPKPSAEEIKKIEKQDKKSGGMPWYSTIRIGMARSSSVFGPWHRPDAPTLDINPSSWDCTVTTNPCPCIAPDGRILLYYRSGQAKLGLATAASPEEPFSRPFHKPVVDPGEGLRIEDPFVFWNGSFYEMVCKDLTGEITGEFHAGIHLISPDGIEWTLAPYPKAWSREIEWDDGTTTIQANIERPFILFEEGEPRWLFAATADGPGAQNGLPGFYYADNTWNLVIPLT